jgi:serine/threonine-protein kinase
MDPMVGETLAHYRVLAHIGSGGMGDVYRAEDLRLRRIVALKTLRCVDHTAEGADRLLAEARAASVLSHPNIAVVYETSDVVHHGHRVGYIAMEFVDGETVGDLIGRGALDVDRVLDIGAQVADALADAHEHGLVHRDLKPSNVMVTAGGRVKVLDFGVAQRQPARFAAPDDDTRTAESPHGLATFVGTLPYSAPEQATGRRVDGRADAFSLGVMLFEMATGRKPFAGENTAQVLEAILREDVLPFGIEAGDARVAQLELFARGMMARDPDRRPASMRDVQMTLATIRHGGRLADSGSALDPGSVVVIGFANISGSPEDDWLGAGIAETLTTDAGQLEGVTVVSRERVSEALRTILQQTEERGDPVHLRAGRELNAKWVISGGFQRSGDAVRVTASVLDVATGQLAATTKVDGSLHAIFDVQDRLARALVTALRPAVAPHGPAQQETDVVEAYEAFSRGVLNRRAESFEALDRAVWLFERACTLDPSYARAHLELGAAYASKADYLSMPELRGRAIASLRKALELQPSYARAWRELGGLLVGADLDTEGMAAIRRALALDPDDGANYAAMARALFIGYGRFAEAAGWYERALERNANGGWYALQLAHCAALLREFSRADRAAARAIELQEAFLSGREGLAIAGGYIRAGHIAALQGRHTDALTFFDREIDFLSRMDHPLRNRILVELNARIGGSYLQLGQTRKAQAVLDVALESFERRVRLGADDPFTRYYAAAVHALRGDAEPAIAFLERAVTQQRGLNVARARIEPEFDRIRTDPRFQRLLETADRAVV